MVVLDAAIHESFAQKAACPLESVDASYPNKVGAGQSESDLSPELERQTYSEKRKFWEDISRKRESYQRSESEVSRASQLTINESDSESCLPNIVSEEGDGTTEGISDVMRSETIEDINLPDISECSVAEKAHYFEEQIQKEMKEAKTTPRLQQQESEKDKLPLFRGKSIDDQKGRTEDVTKRDIDIEEKHVAESREIEKILKVATEDTKWSKETKDIDKKEKDTDEGKDVREEVQKMVVQPVMEICKELLNKERELAEETQSLKYAEEVSLKTDRPQDEKELSEMKKLEKPEEVIAKTISADTKTEEVKIHPEEIVKEHEVKEDIQQQIQKETKEEITKPIKMLQEEIHISDTKPDISTYTAVTEEIKTQEKPDVSTDVVQEVVQSRPETPHSKEIVKEKMSGRKIITEETTIIYTVQKDGTLVQEQVLKSVQIEGANGDKSVTQIPEISMETKMFEKSFPEDIEKLRMEKIEEKQDKKFEDKSSFKGEASEMLQKVEEIIAKQVADINLEKETKPSVDTEVKQIKKESRIPISTSMAEKDKSQKEARVKTTDKEEKSPEKEKDIVSPSGKKKEFESRIPKRIVEGAAMKEKDTKKDLPGQKDGETITVTEKTSSEEVTSRHEERSTTKSKTQTFSKTFTDAQDAFKMFEDISAMKDKDFATVTSKIDTKATSKIEKKEILSSEISSGADKFITHEEKEKVERKKSSESKLTKESPAETIEEKKSKSEEVDKTAMQKMSMNVTEGKEVIDASASESRAESKKEELFKLLEDKKGTAMEKSGTSRIRESDVDVAIRIKKDDTKEVENIKESPEAAKDEKIGKVEMLAQGQSYKENLESFKVEQFIPSQKYKSDSTEKAEEDTQFQSKKVPESLEEREQLIAKEMEARNIAEDLIQSIESEIEKRSSTSGLKPQMLSKKYLDQLMTESIDTDHEKLADDLTRKFESMIKKSFDEQLTESKADHPIEAALSKTSIQEETFEKESTRDSISFSEDITKDEESSHDREESLPSSQAKFQDRDITMSPSSISEQIELEETIDVDTGELEDLSKPTSSPQSEKLRSDRSSSHIEPLQKDIYSDTTLSKDKMVSEISGARVLEILEPSVDSRQDSVDMPSLELDEHKISEQTSKDVASLHESAAVDSLEKIAQEKDATVSSSTVSEDVNVDYPPSHEHVSSTTISSKEYDAGDRHRADSFEIESPPLVSPRTKLVHDLEIKPVNWMIGDEKIEISETLQPSQVFNQELEEYETSIRRARTSSQDESVDLEQESVTKSSEDISVIESVKESVTSSDVNVVVTTTTTKITKFTVIPVAEPVIEPVAEPVIEPVVEPVIESVTEPDFDNELIENKLDVTCQELVDTLKREYDAKTPTEEDAVGLRQSISREDFDLETSITEAVTEEIPMKEEEAKDLTEYVFAKIAEIKLQEADTESFQQEISAVQVETELEDTSKASPIKKEIEDSTHIAVEEAQKDIESAAEKIEKSEVKEEIKTTVEAEKDSKKQEVSKCARVDDVLKEWTETYLTKIKPPSEEYKRHMEKTTDKHDKPSKSMAPPSDTCALKIKKDDLQSVDLSARYAITVLDQVVKKEIAEVKESLEAARQDLIEELSENSQTVFQIKDSPSEFQFKLQPESIPNDLPFLYKPPSIEHVPAEVEPEAETETTTQSELPVAKTQELEEVKQEEARDTIDDKSIVQAAAVTEDKSVTVVQAPEIDIEKREEKETVLTLQDDQQEDEDEGRPSPLPISRSSDISSDIDNRDDSYSLAPPHPVPRRRHKPSRISKRVKTSESEADVGSSSGESNYQSCEYESGSRPSSSDVEAMQSAAGGVQSGTASEYETAMMSIEHEGSKTLPTSQEYQTAVSSLSSRESMKSLNSLSSGHLGSIDSTSELSETLVPSEEADDDEDEIDENLESALDAEQELVEASDSSGSEEIPMDETMDKIDSHIPCRMKRSSEMIFQQIMDDVSLEAESMDDVLEENQVKVADSATSTSMEAPGALQSVDIMTSRVSEDGIQSVCTQVISTRVTRPSDSEELEEDLEEAEGLEEEKDVETTDAEQRLDVETAGDEGLEPVMQTTSVHSMLQQASMSLSSASGMSFDTVIEKDRSERHSPDSDSFELVDKPDIIDDFVVIEEVGREAEELDSEGKSIRISSIPQTSGKQYDRDLENLMTENKEEQVSTSQASKNDLFDFDTEESPPQASNDDQSQSYSDEEPYEGKKWIEMQFQADPRVYDIEYDRGPLEDIKEEEITDFEAGSSRVGSLGSHKESIGSVGSMRGSFGSTPDYDVLGKKYFNKSTDHDTVSLTSLQEFEHLESTMAAENSRRLQCGSQDSVNNGSLPRRYMTGRSGHGDDISLSSLKDFEGLEKACREAHLMELRAREEEELLEHESPENKYKMENLPRSRTDTSATGSFNPSTSGSDDYEKRIKEIDEIIRIAQSNVEKLDRQDDTTEDISQIEITDAERVIGVQPVPETLPEETEEIEEARAIQKETNVMETSTDSLELEENAEKKHPLCRSSDSLEMKTTLDFPSLSSDSLNNVAKDAKETPSDVPGQFAGSARRISSDSLEMPLLEQQDVGVSERSSDSNGHRAEEESVVDSSVRQALSTETDARNGKTKTLPSSDT